MKKARPFSLGLRFKLAISVLLTVLLSMSFLSLTLLTMIRAELFGQVITQAGNLSRSMERFISLDREVAHLPGSHSPAPLYYQQILSLFFEEEQMLGLALFDHRGRLIARQGYHFNLPEKGWLEVAGKPDYQLISEGRPGILASTFLNKLTPPIRLVILFSLDKVNQVIVLSQLRTIFQVSLFALIIFLFLLSIFTFMVINPLKTLKKGIEKITSGNLDYRVDIVNRDELGFLAESFNNMVGTLQENKETIEAQFEELKKAHQSTIVAQTKLIAAEKMASLGTMAAGVAHEVGNPLGAVIGYINLLKKGNLSDEDRADFLSRVSSELDRIHQIMLEMLDYARSTNEPTSAVDINDIIQELVRNLKEENALGHLNITLDLQENIPTLKGFPHKLEQVFTNMIKNAIWATGTSGTLEIKTESANIIGGDSDSKQLIIIFRDDGCGILEQNLDKVFDPFFTTRHGQGGTGLGLPISRRIIEEMGGSITVYSVPGKKTSFTITLPVYNVEEDKNGQ